MKINCRNHQWKKQRVFYWYLIYIYSGCKRSIANSFKNNSSFDLKKELIHWHFFQSEFTHIVNKDAYPSYLAMFCHVFNNISDDPITSYIFVYIYSLAKIYKKSILFSHTTNITNDILFKNISGGGIICHHDICSQDLQIVSGCAINTSSIGLLIK